ncbi:alpha/beta hydrolase [Nucisporomicrobium flavum]|uniref:alpha/beta hydrolase n=1 Tax=Nucisporomicrobium flavum TaxID=2785915 RepID=UPI0018F2E3F3|nr:alpha/beta hydrolase fold domain-containing protein [Nucisporomicrobium flavum]
MTIAKRYGHLPMVLATAALLTVGVGVANAGERTGATAATTTAAAAPSGWEGITREQVRIDLGAGWVTDGELTYPAAAGGRLPLVVFLHGSGRNDMNQTVPGGKGSTFVRLAQAAGREGYATLRFNKRGVTGIGPVRTTDPAQLTPEKPYQRTQLDAAAVVRFAARSPRVNPSKIMLLGHSEGTNVAANLAAEPKRYGIPKPAGVVAMAVVGKPVEQLVTFQVYGRLLLQLHDEFDLDGDGRLTAVEASDGLVGQPEEVAALFRSVLLDGGRVKAGTDRNHDGRIAVDAEAGPVLRELTGIDAYPEIPSLDPFLVTYLKDLGRFPTVERALPRFSGPTLLLNGENDLETPARAALAADAAVAAAGNRDHKVVIYPGLAHTMNLSPRYADELGEPDQRVIDEVQGWLKAHR